jgi:hypothetical protein
MAPSMAAIWTLLYIHYRLQGLQPLEHDLVVGLHNVMGLQTGTEFACLSLEYPPLSIKWLVLYNSAY